MLMKAAIFGTKKEALFLEHELTNNHLAEVQCFIDNDRLKDGTYINELPILSFNKFIDIYKNQNSLVIVAMRGSKSRADVLLQLEESGVTNIGVFKFSYCDYNISFDDISDAVIMLSEMDRPFMPYLEYNVSDSCNLKCKGCTHFSNLFDNSTFIDIERFKSELSQLNKKVFIGQLRLMGGEPFLNPRLSDFVCYSRSILPKADINIVTNGLLIPSTSHSILECIKNNNVGLHISRYYPTEINLDRITQVLKKEGVHYYIEEKVIDKFGKCLKMNGLSNTEKSQSACIALGCRFLRDGRLYKCPFEGLIDKFVDYYDISLYPENRGIDIYDEKIEWKEALTGLLKSPVEMCSYCAESVEMFDWQVETEPKITDWIVNV